MPRASEGWRTNHEPEADGPDGNGPTSSTSSDDLVVSDVIRTNERQIWFVAEHLAGANPTNVG